MNYGVIFFRKLKQSEVRKITSIDTNDIIYAPYNQNISQILVRDISVIVMGIGEVDLSEHLNHRSAYSRMDVRGMGSPGCRDWTLENRSQIVKYTIEKCSRIVYAGKNRELIEKLVEEKNVKIPERFKTKVAYL